MLSLSNCPCTIEKLIERFQETLSILEDSSNKYLKKMEHELSQLSQADEKLVKKYEMALAQKQEHVVKAIQRFKKFLKDNLHNICLEFDYPKYHFFVRFIMAQNNAHETLAFIEQYKQITKDKLDWQVQDQVFFQYFHSLNEKYQYFECCSSGLLTIYKNLTETLRFLMKTVEYQYNYAHDRIFFEIAYKLMALFINEENISQTYDLLCERMDEVFKNRSMHDALLIDLNSFPNKKNLKRFFEWQILFYQKKGFWQAVKSFAKHSQIIELKLESVKEFNLENVQYAELNFNYPRASEDEEFAELCKTHNVSQETFDECLNLIQSGWPKKVVDNLPHVIVADENNEYFWVKLPTHDKRALILGDITECCQSIGGESHACVIDGITRPNNGFYVLLKKVKKEAASPFISIDPPQINYKDFKIIAQSYAWISQTGNLCLDSLEALDHVLKYFENPEQKHYAQNLEKLLENFAKQVLICDTSIKRVTLGLGGKTPENLFVHPKENIRIQSSINETMREGFDYGDAKKQYRMATCLQMDKKQNELILKLFTSNKSKITTEEYHLIAIVKYLLEHALDIPDALANLEKLCYEFPQFKQQIQITLLPRLIQPNFEFNWEVLYPLHPQDLHQGNINPLRLAWHLSSQPMQNWPSYLKNCDVDMIKKLLSWRDENKQGLLNYAACNFDSFKIFLDHLTDEEKYSIALQTNIIQSISHAPQMQLLFEKLNPKQIFTLLIQPNQKSENALFKLIEHPQIFNLIWQSLSTAEKIELTNQISLTGECLLFHPKAPADLILNLLQELNSFQKFSLLTQKKLNIVDGFRTIADKPSYVEMLFKELTPEQKFTILTKTNQDDENLVFCLKDHPESLRITLGDLSSEQKLTVISQINAFNISLLFSPNLKLSSLEILLENISVEQKFRLLMNEHLDLADVFHCIIQNSKHMPEHVYENPQINIPDHIPENVATRIWRLFAGLTAQQKFEVLSKTNAENENTLFSLVAAPEILSSMWQDLTHLQKLHLLNQLDCTGISILFHPTVESSVLESLIKNITPEEKYALLMAEDLDLTMAFITLLEKKSYLPKEIQNLIELDQINRITILFEGLTSLQKFDVLMRANHYETRFYYLICHEEKLFQSLFVELSIEKRLVFLKKFKDFFITACNFQDKLHHLLGGFSYEQIHEFACSTFGDSNYPIYYLLSWYSYPMEVLLQSLSASQKFTMLTSKKMLIQPYCSLLEFNKDNLESLALLLKDLTPEQVKVLVEEKNSDDKNVLQLLKPDSEEFQFIMKAMKPSVISQHGLFLQSVSDLEEENKNFKKIS